MSVLSKDSLITKYTFISKSVKKIDGESCSLFFQINIESIQYLLLNEAEEIVALKHVQSQNGITSIDLNSFLSEEKVLQQRFKKVVVSVFDVPYTIVPVAFYSEEKKLELLEFVNPLNKQRVCLHDELPVLESKLIYALQRETKELLNKAFPNHQIFSGISQCIVSFQPKKKSKQLGLIHFRKNSIDVLLFKQKLIFCNTFSVFTAEDVLYYLLSAIELNELNTQEMELMISGEVEKESIWMKMIRNYFNQISFCEITSDKLKSIALEKDIQHQFYQLFNLLNCE